jgi:hypothetical protein
MALIKLFIVTIIKYYTNYNINSRIHSRHIEPHEFSVLRVLQQHPDLRFLDLIESFLKNRQNYNSEAVIPHQRSPWSLEWWQKT